ncbi:MAG: D-alanyl-D-alanine carboxypeptidase [Ruminococcaceae bacterium]|nr:D-alanyl-D-alanine carboxypeptidase [Oscillospiraceae bacterium]
MKICRIVSVFLAVVLMTSLCLTPAQALEPIDVEAKAALLVDEGSGLVLYQENIHEELFPASITKVMTALLVIEAINRGELSLTQNVTTSATALVGLAEDGSTAGIEEGEILTVEQLLYCMLVQSANEACNILAEAVTGSVSTFVDRMNARAAELGCENSHYVNTTGLHDPQHYSSAWDVYLVTREAMKHVLFMTICGSKSYTVPPTNKTPQERVLHSTNYLISNWRALGYLYDGAEGIKTGSTSDAGNCLVSSAVRGSRRLISVILGAAAQGETPQGTKVMSFYETSRLFDYGFDQFTYKTVAEKEDLIQEVPVSLSKDTNCVMAHPQKDTQALLPKDMDPAQVERTVTLVSDTIQAPITKGDVVGELSFQYNGQVCATVPLLALDDVKASSLLVAQHAIVQFFSQRLVQILTIAIVLLIAAIFLWWRLAGRNRRYGSSRRRYRNRAYRGRGRRR